MKARDCYPGIASTEKMLLAKFPDMAVQYTEALDRIDELEDRMASAEAFMRLRTLNGGDTTELDEFSRWRNGGWTRYKSLTKEHP